MCFTFSQIFFCLQHKIESVTDVLHELKNKTCHSVQSKFNQSMIWQWSNYFPCFSGSTLSVRTSPTHGGSSSNPAPLPIPLQRSAVINPSTLPSSQASRIHNDEACIQVANIESDPSSPQKEYEICSSKNLCGPNPKKVTVIVALILSIWASFILGVNIHKKVSLLFQRGWLFEKAKSSLSVYL